MNRVTKTILGLLFLALVIEVVIIAPQTLDQIEDPIVNEEVANEEGLLVEQTLSGIHLIETRNEEREWELWSDQATTLRGKKEWQLKKVKVKFFGKDGLVFNAVGQTGTINVLTKNMTIEGQVVTTSSNGYIFETDQLVYGSKARVLSSPGVVKMMGVRDANGQRMHLTGEILEANLDSALIEIRKNVYAEKPFKGEKRVYVKSRRAQFSGRSQSARFLDDVEIDFETMHLTGPDAIFNYDSEKDLVTSMMVQGGVKVSDLEKWATSDQVNVEFEKEKFVFRGQPRVVQNNDELRGEEIVFFNGGKRVQVKKARANVHENSVEATN